MTTPYVDPSSVHNPSVGASPPASWGDTLNDNQAFFARRPGAVTQRVNGTVNVPNNTATPITFGAVDLRDTDDYHSPSTNNSRFTIPTGLGGWYRLNVQVRWTANSSGHRDLYFRTNGTTTIEGSHARIRAISGQDVYLLTHVFAELSAGDYVEAVADQNSGSTLGVTRATLSIILEAQS